MLAIRDKLWLAEKFVPLQGKKQQLRRKAAANVALWLAEKFVPLQGKKQQRRARDDGLRVVISWKICTFAG